MSCVACFEPITDIALLETRWRALEARARTPSFFVGWTWMGSWLAALRAAGIALPQLMSVAEEGRAGEDVALALIGRGKVRRKLGMVPACWLNECGDQNGDRPYIEYNGLLCRAGREADAARAFCEAMGRRKDWTVLYMAGMAPDAPCASVADVRRRVLRDASPAWYVDLEAVRGAQGGYLSLLGPSTRSQIRRSLKEEPAAPQIGIIRDAAAIPSALEDMAALNRGRHHDNAWDNPFFRDFARRIALAGLADGAVEIARITVAGDILGYLLNFRHDGRVMNYQSAFAPPRAAKSKPGLMCHAAMVEYHAARGQGLYSFLAGKDRYKQNLATGAEELRWWALERLDFRLEAEALARRLLRR